MSSKETNSKKTTRKSSRSSKKKVGLFKKKTIKPKVKLDTNKVLVMSIAVIISCIILLVATFNDILHAHISRIKISAINYDKNY